MKRPFVEEMIELCEKRGYQVQAVGIDGDAVEVILKHERSKRTKKDIVAKDFKIKSPAAV